MLRLSVIASSLPLTVQDIVLVSMVQLALLGLEVVALQGSSLVRFIKVGLKWVVGNTIRRLGGKSMELTEKAGQRRILRKNYRIKKDLKMLLSFS